MDKEIFVYVDLQGAPLLVGRLWARTRKERESVSFEYEKTWLGRADSFALNS
jgi:serine/threonine-protein kinase HipA